MVLITKVFPALRPLCPKASFLLPIFLSLFPLAAAYGVRALSSLSRAESSIAAIATWPGACGTSLRKREEVSVPDSLRLERFFFFLFSCRPVLQVSRSEEGCCFPKRAKIKRFFGCSEVFYVSSGVVLRSEYIAKESVALCLAKASEIRATVQ